jgi:hypothetical protein
MTMAQFWAGRVFGTNTGNVFVELDGDVDAYLVYCGFMILLLVSLYIQSKESLLKANWFWKVK